MRIFIKQLNEYKTDSFHRCEFCFISQKKIVEGTYFHKECGNWLCSYHGGICCIENCDVEECRICYEPTLKECEICTELACDDHHNTCSICDMIVCDNCKDSGSFRRCKTCGSGYCAFHADEELNGDDVCKECVESEKENLSRIL